MNAPEKQLHNLILPDVQGTPDHRDVAINHVGVRGLRYPLRLVDAAGEAHATVATVTMTVGLPPTVKGTHMSRFVEVLEQDRDALDLGGMRQMLTEMLARLEAEGADVNRTDGARVNTPDGWWLLRASNTQDVLVARAEAALGVQGLPLGVGIPGCLSHSKFPAESLRRGGPFSVFHSRLCRLAGAKETEGSRRGGRGDRRSRRGRARAGRDAARAGGQPAVGER